MLLKSKSVYRILIVVLFLQFHVSNAQRQAEPIETIETTTKKSGGFFSGVKSFFGGGKTETTTEQVSTSTTTSTTTKIGLVPVQPKPNSPILPSPVNTNVKPNPIPVNLPQNPTSSNGQNMPFGAGMGNQGTRNQPGKMSSSYPGLSGSQLSYGFGQPSLSRSTTPYPPGHGSQLSYGGMKPNPQPPIISGSSTTTTTKNPNLIPPAQPTPASPIRPNAAQSPTIAKAPLAQPEEFPALSTTKKPIIKEDFPALPTPKKPLIKEDFPPLPIKPGQSGPTPTPASAWSTPKNPTDVYRNRVSFVPHQPGSTTAKPAGTSGSSTPKPLASDEELITLTEALFNKETNSQLKYITLNLQGKTRSTERGDEAPNPLFTVNEQALESPTIAKLRPLFNNYELDTSINEYVTPIERKEENEFLDLVMATPVMRHTMSFLQSKGIVSPDPKTHRDLVKQIWFTLYSRGGGKISSSAFEHVFVTEMKNGSVIGLHNWVFFNDEEKAGNLDYNGYIKKLDLGTKGSILKVRFTYNGILKPVNSLFIGTSPELELALYTLCFEMRADKDCPVSLGGNKFTIVTHSWRYRGKNLIGSAYPEI